MVAGNQQTTTSDILFLKRLLFIKASLDNEQSISNFAVPFDEDKTFSSKTFEKKVKEIEAARTAVNTAPTGAKRPPRVNMPYALEDDPEEKPLALTNGGLNDDLNDS